MSSKKTVLSAVFAAGISLCSASVLAAVSAEEGVAYLKVSRKEWAEAAVRALLGQGDTGAASA